MSNRLAHEISPYLLQHADNPVDWYPWGNEALDRARREDKPILLSIGYSACHWCHVMAHESFEDPDVAALMNELFVNIKVDREERPDLDAIYMQAVQRLTGQGGWPLTVFLAPDATPFFGGTYFPPRPRHGLPGFVQVIEGVSHAYRERREEVHDLGRRLAQSLEPKTEADVNTGLTEAHLAAAVELTLRSHDPENGGFGSAPKFPNCTALTFLLTRARRGDKRCAEALQKTLAHMAEGGIFDQVGGGFHRYAVDSHWVVPHFEKMLYDNAQLALLYVQAYQFDQNPRWRTVGEQTLDYLCNQMRLPEGGLASSEDADSEGGEGSFYLWTADEFDSVLGADAAVAGEIFGVTREGNFDGGANVLTMNPAAAATVHLDAIRQRLYQYRSQRPHPQRDDKAVVVWNALTVEALAQAGMILRRRDYLDAAIGCMTFMLTKLRQGDGMHHFWRGGAAKGVAFLDDIAALASSLLTLYECTGQSYYFAEALHWAQYSELFSLGDGYSDVSSQNEPLLVRPRNIDDHPVASGQSILARLFLRLWRFTADDEWYRRAEAIIKPHLNLIERNPVYVGALTTAADLYLGPNRQLHISGEMDDPRLQELVQISWDVFDPYLVRIWGETADIAWLPAGDGEVRAYFCEDFTCRLPTADAQVLRQELGLG